jgi:hypothetical protein
MPAKIGGRGGGSRGLIMWSLKPNTFANFEVPAKIAHRNFFFAISGAVNQKNLTISCLVIIQYQKMAKKIQINLSNDQKKSSDEQYLQAPRTKLGKVFGFSASQ